MNEAESARHEVPYAFIKHLIQAPPALKALHSTLTQGSGMNCPAHRAWSGRLAKALESHPPWFAESHQAVMYPSPSKILCHHRGPCHAAGVRDKDPVHPTDGIWTAVICDTAQRTPAALSAAASSAASAVQPGPSVLLMPVQQAGDAASCMEQLVGACLQSILRRYPSLTPHLIRLVLAAKHLNGSALP